MTPDIMNRECFKVYKVLVPPSDAAVCYGMNQGETNQYVSISSRTVHLRVWVQNE
jgi:hypothetical protein